MKFWENLFPSKASQSGKPEVISKTPDAPGTKGAGGAAHARAGYAWKEGARSPFAAAAPLQVRFRNLTPGNISAAHAPSLESAIAWHKAGDFARAESAYKQILSAQAGNADALHYLGMLYLQAGRLAAGLESISRSLEIHPRQFAALGNRARGLMDAGRFDEAKRDLEAAARLAPDSPDIKLSLASLLLHQGDAGNALELIAAAEKLAPESGPVRAQAWQSRAAALYRLNRYPEALHAYQAALRMDPTLGGAGQRCAALSNMAGILMVFDRPAEAAGLLRQLVAIDPAFPYAAGQLLAAQMRRACWTDYAALREAVLRQLRAGRKAINPFSLLNLHDDPADHHACARAYAAERFAADAPRLWQGETYRHARLRVAYVSADFHDHATAHLMAGLFEHHDRGRFEVFAISYGPDDGSPMRRRLRQAFEHFVEIDARATDADIARQIRARQIDIAVDLKGYTHEGRPGIFACRPAPVQVSYLGYPGTLGADFMDFLVADRYVIPETDQAHYAEKIVYMPNCYQATDNRRRIADWQPSRAELGLPDDGFVFCCFNNPTKITPAIFDVWMRLLTEVPDSVLWLFQGTAEVLAHLRAEAEHRGVKAARLVFAERLPQDRHLARHACADLFLDTLPYNAHTTASDALWAGLPVLTVAGASFPARVAGSILRSAGLADLIAPDHETYVAMAKSLAHDPARMRELKERVRKAKAASSLFDTAGFARDFEQALLAIHR